MTSCPLELTPAELRERVLGRLTLYVKVAGDELLTLTPWLSLSADQRVLVLLCAWRALGRPAVTPVEIARATGIPGNTVRPALQRLHRQGLVERTVQAEYRARLSAWARVMEWV